MPALVGIIILMAVVGAGFVVSGVYLVLGIGPAQIVVGVFMLVAAVCMRMGMMDG